ncbi:MAG TPA: hypothetical protein DCR20_09755 [Planctomycetaceae bacterium]|nr:hypothetical protein [Planctomycetaceae bacterium]
MAPSQPSDCLKVQFQRLRSLPFGIACCLALILTLASTTPSACAAQLAVDQLQVGFGGHGRVGAWLPLHLQLQGLTPLTPMQLTVLAPDARGDVCESVVAAVQSDAAGSIIINAVFNTGRLDGRVQLQLTDGGGAVLWNHSIECREGAIGAPQESPPAVARQLLLYRHQAVPVLAIGPVAGLQELANERVADSGGRNPLLLLQSEQSALLPATTRGLDSLELLVLASDFALTEQQTAAVRSWVLSGGHLVISCGERGPALLQSPLGQWLQPIFEIPSENTVYETLDLTAVQNFVLGATALQTNRNPVRCLRIPSRQPRVVAQALNEPVISRAVVGAGVVTILAVDVNARPLDKWLSLSQFLETLLFGPDAGTAERSQRGTRISSIGVSDLSTQLAAAVDAVPAEQRWSTWDAMLMMVILLALIGPLDWFLVVRTLRSPRLTWATFPLIIGSTCLLVAVAAAPATVPDVSRAVSLLDVTVDHQGQDLRVRTWASLSTQDSQYASVNLESSETLQNMLPATAESVVSWSGRAEDIYGGMYRPGGAGLGQMVSRRSDLQPSGFSAVPLLAGGSTSLIADVRTSAPAAALVESRLTLPSSDLLEGEFQHALPFAVRDWVVFCGNRAYAPADRASDEERILQPQSAWTRHRGNVRISEVRDFLRGVRLVRNPDAKRDINKSQSTQVSRPWDISIRNPLDILLMTSLYQSAGGQVFVKLDNYTLRRDEVSDMVDLNGALLVGWAETELCTVKLNDAIVKSDLPPKTIVRVFLPVRRVGVTAGSMEADPKPQ